MAARHTPNVSYNMIREGIIEEVIKKTVQEELIDGKTKYFINSTGRFVVGGPMGDCGVTGRKIIADTYGGQGSHGGGAFSGKDPSKVDRTALYMARYVAKNIVAAGLADRVWRFRWRASSGSPSPSLSWWIPLERAGFLLIGSRRS